MTLAAPTPAELDEIAPSWAARLETLAVALALAVLTNALIGPLFAPNQGNLEAGEQLRVIWLPVYAVALGVSALHWRAMLRVWPAALALSLMLAWPIASRAWSLDPETTGRRSLALVLTTLFGLMLAARYSWRQLVALLAASYGVLAVMSLIAGAAFPAWGINHTTNPGDWKGVWYEKNALGANMAVGGLAALCASIVDTRRRRLWAAVVLLDLALLVLAKSATSLVVFGVGAAIVSGLAMVRRGPVWAVVALWVSVQGAGLLAAFAWLAPGALLQALGKDPTLTGRTGIWESLLRRSSESPWLGYGYQAFWSPARHGPAALVRKETRWLVPSAHNGWLEVLVQLGWVGVTLFALNYLLTVSAAIGGAPRRQDGGFALVFVAVIGVLSLSESVILQHNSMSWVLYVAVMAKLFQLAPATLPRRVPAPVSTPSLAASGA